MNDPSRVNLGEMTWTEIEMAIQNGFETVIIPSGSVEQHGPHLPLLTDSLIGERVAEKTARKMGRTLVAPIIRPGLSYHHLAFPGSLTLSPETFGHIYEEYCLALARHGFHNYILTSGHGGNFSFLDGISLYLQDLLRQRGYVARVIPEVNSAAYVKLQQNLVGERFGVPAEEACWHADVLETACMLAIRPDLVHMERAAAGWVGDNTKIDLNAKDFRDWTPNGVLGDPRRATAEMGFALLDALSDWMAVRLRSRLGWES
jgi:creatinine amidohydrolase